MDRGLVLGATKRNRTKQANCTACNIRVKLWTVKCEAGSRIIVRDLYVALYCQHTTIAFLKITDSTYIPDRVVLVSPQRITDTKFHTPIKEQVKL